MARLKQTQRKSVGSAPRLPVEIVAAIAAEIMAINYKFIKYELWILASDSSGQIDMILENYPASKCICKSIREICDEGPEVMFPYVLKTLENKEYTIKILIHGENVKERSKLYIVKDIMEGPYTDEGDSDNEHTNIKHVQKS
ncbi:hypothetical protein AgCh_031356 [Apium graveolens]